jgi:hypothetical protein
MKMSKKTVRTVQAVGVLGPVLLAVLSLELQGCTASDTVPGAGAPTLTVTTSMATRYLTGGAIFSVTASASAADKPIVGLTVTFAGVPSTVTMTPATATTDVNGSAISYALVSYGSEGTVVASGGGVASSPVAVSLLNPPIRLTRPSLCVPDAGSFKVAADGGAGPSGTLYEVCTTAQIDGAADAGTVPGISVTFSVLFPTGSGAPSISPVATITDPSGKAMATIAVPPGVPSFVVVATTGTSTVENTFP